MSDPASNDNSTLCPQTLSRRGFLALLAATGAVSSFEFWGGLVVKAHAAEPTALGNPFQIYVVKRWEVPVYVFDVSNASEPKGVAGATVHVTSYYNGKEATVVTDANGIAVFDIRDMAEPDPDQDVSAGDPKIVYAFFGHVIIEKEGFRTFETGMMRFYGANELATATEPATGRPYVQLATFDDWDVQYADATTFIATPQNNDTHTIAVKAHVFDGKDVQVTVSQEGGPTLTIQVAPDVQGIAAASFQGRFLSLASADASQAFAVGKPVTIGIVAGNGSGDAFSFTSRIVIERGPVDTLTENPSMQFSVDSLAPPSTAQNDDQENLQETKVTLPEGIPVIGGKDCKLCIPGIPVYMVVDPAGMILIGAKFNGSLHKKPDGGDLSDIWMRDSKGHSRYEYTRKKDAYYMYYDLKKTDLTSDGDKRTVFGRMPHGFGLDPSLAMGVCLVEEWDDKLLVWRGDIRGFADVALAVSYTLQFIVASVPVYLRFEFNVDANLSLEAGVEAREISNGIKPHFSAGSGLTFQPTAEVAVGAGVGIVGFISVGVRGSVFVSFFLKALMMPEGKKNPHMIVSGGAHVSIACQVLLAQFSVDLYKHEWPYIWSNWDSEKHKLGAAETVAGNPTFYVRRNDGTLGYSLDETGSTSSLLQAGLLDSAITLVKEAELSKLAECAATPTSGSGYAFVEARGESATTGLSYDIKPLALGENGLVPTETLVYRNVFSDPRMKAVSVDGTLYLVRILPVAYPAGTRSRLTLAALGSDGTWGKPQVVDFSFPDGSPCAREETFDYDFDVVSSDEGPGAGVRWKDGGAMRFLLISGTRPQGDDSKLSGIVSHSVSAFLSLDANGAIKTQHVYFDDFNRADQASMLVFPRILTGKAADSDEWLTVAFALHRVAAVGSSLFEAGYKEYPADCLYNSNGSHCISDRGFIDVEESMIKVKGGARAPEVLTDVKQDVGVSLMKMTDKELFLAYHYVLAVQDDPNQAPLVKTVVIARFIFFSDFNSALLLGSAARGTSVKPWAGLGKPGAVLCANGRALHTIWVGDGSNDFGNLALGTTGETSFASTLDLQSSAVSLDSSIQLDSFALSSDGTLLYYATTRDGKQHDTYDDDGTRHEGAETADYRIWASRVVTDANGAYKFMEPFAIAQLAHPADSLVDLTLPGAYGFLQSSITNLADSTADIYLNAIPLLAHLTLLGFSSVSHFVCAGNEEQFHVAVRNDGNTAIDSFTLVISRDGTEVARIPVSIPVVSAEPDVQDVVTDSDAVLGRTATEASLTAGEAVAAEGETGLTTLAATRFDVPTEAGVLIPGKARTYRFNWTIPEDWTGETTLDVEIDPASFNVSTQVACCEEPRIRAMAKPAHEVGLVLENKVSTKLAFASTLLEKTGIGVAANPYRYENGDASSVAKTGDDALPKTVSVCLLAALAAGTACAAGTIAQQNDAPPS